MALSEPVLLYHVGQGLKLALSHLGRKWDSKEMKLRANPFG